MVSIVMIVFIQKITTQAIFRSYVGGDLDEDTPDNWWNELLSQGELKKPVLLWLNNRNGYLKSLRGCKKFIKTTQWDYFEKGVTGLCVSYVEIKDISFLNVWEVLGYHDQMLIGIRMAIF